MLSSIVLAAGKSRRMGRPKLLLPWRNGTILGQTVDNLLSSAVDEVIVVLGYRAEEVKEILTDKPVKLIVNPDYEQGLSASIIAGLNQVDSQAEAVMIALGDQPLITGQVIDRLIDGFNKCDKGIVVPTYHGRRGHPVIFAMKYKERLLDLKGDTGGRQIIEDQPGDVLEIPISCDSIHTDIDTMDDYLAGL
jgi:molybdenum cofactor cytidylyltransferase